MVKQGKFASATKQVKLKNHHQKMTKQQATIKKEQLFDFMMVRFGLTTKKRIAKPDQETVQRFLTSLLTDLEETAVIDLKDLAEKTLERINVMVPWQYYRVIVANWPQLQAFLSRELPAVPLAERLIVKANVSKAAFQALVTRQLAVNSMLLTFNQQPELLKTVSSTQITQLTQAFTEKETIAWDKVAAMFKPFSKQIDAQNDSATTDWLETLMKRW